jgi:hypothetical protein
MIRSGMSLPSLPVIVTTRARGDFGATGNGPSPRRRASRVTSAPIVHHSGKPVRVSIRVWFSFAVSAETADGLNRAGSNGLDASLMIRSPSW